MEWSPRPAGTALRLLLGAGLAFAAWFAVPDAPGRLLVGAAAVGVLVHAAHDVLVRPRLAARPDGIVTRAWGRRRQLPWQGLRIRIRTTRRLGTTVRTLELDSDRGDDDVLVVLGRRDLGVPVEEVARTLRSLLAEIPEGPRPTSP